MRSFLLRLIAPGCLALLLAPSVPAADDLRVRQLENEVMRLQRQVDAQSRRIDELERATRSAGPARREVPTVRPSNDSPAWLVISNWDRVKPGMKEIEVISILGRPTTVRTEDGKIRALMYAMELGPNAILAGNVRLGDAGVAEVNRPVLK